MSDGLRKRNGEQSCCLPPRPRQAAGRGCCGVSGPNTTTLPAEDSPPGWNCPAGTTPHWQCGRVDTPVGPVSRVRTVLGERDRLGSWKVRWAIGRAHYRVDPGLYAVGTPDAESPVFVSANYNQSFDRLRAALPGLDGWILVLDTRGINVWCAAGKGTFGTDELLRQLDATRLAEVVSGRTLVLPQLGAPGVVAHEVRQRSGWRVRYGPVRAADLPRYLAAGMQATPEMRRVRFPLADRLVVIPVEVMLSLKYFLIVAAAFVLLSGLGSNGYAVSRLADSGLRSTLLLLCAWLGGAALAPALLPWLPGRTFALKGALVGLAVILALLLPALPGTGPFDNWAEAASWLLLIPALASFLTMNFTGASTYTSLSGVRREMRRAVPAQFAATLGGLVLWIAGRFFQ